jgi:hypothetical protein
MAAKTTKSTDQQSAGKPAALHEIERVCRAIQEGRLSTRADLKKASEADKSILENVNEMLDAILIPMQTASTSIYKNLPGDNTAQDQRSLSR